MVRRLASIGAVTLALGIAACDRAPTDPNLDVEALLAAANPSLSADIKPVGSTLPALFRESVARVEREQGKLGVAAALSGWRELQDQLKTLAARADRSAIQEKVEAIHDEELNIVLRTLGSPVLTRIMTDLSLDYASAEGRILMAQSTGADMTRVRSVNAQIRAKIEAARNAIAAGDYKGALDHASQAATLLSGLDYYLIELQRIGGLETLYPQAVEKLSKREDAAARALLARAQQVDAQARTALRSGNRQLAQQKLLQARAQQIDVVLEVAGPRAVRRLVEQVAARGDALRTAITALETNGYDVVRYRRMLNEAADLAQRAGTSADTGDNATALDLGSHAAGMLNALQHLTWK